MASEDVKPIDVFAGKKPDTTTYWNAVDVVKPLPEVVAPRVASTVFLVWEDEVLLGYRMPGHASGAGWQAPGGKVDHGEMTHDAGARETKEECGIEIDPKRLKLIGVQQRENWVCFLYVHRFYGATPPTPTVTEPLKHKEWRWFKWSTVLSFAREDKFLFPFLRSLLTEAIKPSYEREPGAVVWCSSCLGRIPCTCLLGP